MKVQFLSLAQQELDDAVTWYNQQGKGLGRDFLDELDRAVRRAVSFPMSFPEITPGTETVSLGSIPLWSDLRPGRRDGRSDCSGAFTPGAPILDRAPWRLNFQT